MNEKTVEFFCTNCNVSYFPNRGEKLKSQSKFDLPGPEIDSKGHIIGDKMPLVSMIDDKPKPKDSLPRYFKEMEKHGLKITSFTTTDLNLSIAAVM
jgi:hypothetical protein